MSAIIPPDFYVSGSICLSFHKQKRKFPAVIIPSSLGEFFVKNWRFIYEQFMTGNVFLTCIL